jgi:catechol 2,3-dioxygenase-like lactoylglutathione lyase family enzyme
VIGRLEKTVLDCPDPRLLARFYAQVLGMQVVEDDDGWVVIGRAAGWRELAFQRARAWSPPTWPEGEVPQQAHLDVRVTDVEEAERAVLTLGASAVGLRDDARGFRVYLDPAGHPFCLVFGGAPMEARPQFSLR